MPHPSRIPTSRRLDPEDLGSRVEWLSDLVRLEIVLWNRVDQRLREEHGLPLAFFETLYFTSRSPNGRLRIGDLAQALRITVGGTSKVADRVERAGLIRREPDSGDRRASWVVPTPTGKRKLAAAIESYETELAGALEDVLSTKEQRVLHDLVRRMLRASAAESSRTTDSSRR
jgi:DNA-binding MarR family transcriptional regulator